MSVELWRVWLREYGAVGAIALALSHGYSRTEILRVNGEARASELRRVESCESPTSHNHGIKS